MHFIAQNLKTIRKQNGLRQDDLARLLGVKRSAIGAYEEGRADPRIGLLQVISSKFKISLDDLINRSLDDEKNLPTVDASGQSIRILPITIDASEDKEVATLVPVKAAAGYLNGFGDIEFIESLPTFAMPFPELSRDRTYRLFQIQGESMLPVASGSYIIGSYLQDWHQVKNDHCYVIVSKSEGIVYKRLLNNLDDGKLVLKSDNPSFDTYEMPISEVIEIWKDEGFVRLDNKREAVSIADRAVSETLQSINQRLSKIENQLQ